MGNEKSSPAPARVEAVIADYNRGALEKARTAAERLAADYPGDALVRNLLGAICAKIGDAEAAIAHFMRATALDPRFPDPHNNLGVALKSAGRKQEAIESFLTAIRLRPDYAEARFNLANTYRDIDRREEAVSVYESALAIAPGHLGARNNLAIVLNRLERYEEAADHFSKVVRAKPGYADAWNNLGLAHKCLGRETDAIASFRRAIAERPDFAEAHYNLGSYLFDLGRKEEAAASYREALKVRPDFAEAYRSLGAVKRYTPDDPMILRLLELVGREELPDNDRMHACYALGRACEDLDRREEAFDYYSRANALRRAFLAYDPEIERALFRRIRTAFASAGPQNALSGDDAPAFARTPIFVVGMPRSGTSLTEQILSSHSMIHGAGELTTLGRAVSAVWRGADVKRGQLVALRERYLADIERRGESDEPFVADKMHMNYRWIGFILLAMPGAKIVHIKRRSIASCWSIYRHYFADIGNGYAYDFDDIAEYYNGYKDLMAFWNARFPGAIHNFSYEDLTENQEFETRRLLDYLGLPFEQGCIDFHETPRAVATISSMQVRRPLYRGSSDEWRKYERFLRPLIDKVGTD